MTLRIIYNRNKGLYSKSSDYFEKRLEMCKASGFKKEERAFHCYVAGVYMSLGLFEKSNDCNNTALEISKAMHWE